MKKLIIFALIVFMWLFVGCSDTVTNVTNIDFPENQVSIIINYLPDLVDFDSEITVSHKDTLICTVSEYSKDTIIVPFGFIDLSWIYLDTNVYFEIFPISWCEYTIQNNILIVGKL